VRLSLLETKGSDVHDKDGVQQLVQSGERELGLRLHSHRGQSPVTSSLGSLAGEVQKRRLADPGLTSQHQRSAARREAVHHRGDEFGLGLAPDQIANRVGPDGAGHRSRIGARWTGTAARRLGAGRAHDGRR
jgi:hypothetical protein